MPAHHVSLVPHPATCSTKFLTGTNLSLNPSSPPTARASRWNQSLNPTGLQRQLNKELSKILRTDAAIKAIEQKANSKKHANLLPKAVLEALHDAMRQNRWESALKIFGLLRQQQWYQPKSQTYARLLMMLGKCGQPEEASTLLEILQSDGIRPTLDVYTALASAYGQNGRLEEAFAVIDDMKSVSDCVPDAYTYSVLVKSCVKFRRADLIERVLAEMSYVGIECNSVIYNTIIDGYGKARMFEDMETWLTNMIGSDDHVPDIFTLNSVIGAYGNSERITEMERWYDEFQLMGVMADISTFNIMIRSYVKAGMIEKMQSVLYFMEKRFFSPSVVTYNVILEMFGKAGNIKDMDECFKKMKHLGLKPDTITYCTLVSAYGKAGHLLKVDSILRQIENSDVILDTPFFNCIIHAYGQAGDINSMAKMYLMMKERQCKPDGITYATMIRVYNTIGMFEIARDLENEMLAAGKGSRFIGS